MENGPYGLRIAALNEGARALGLTPNLAFADARARVPDLLHEEIDRASDKAALETLAKWMVRFSPLVSVDGADGLILETTGCAHLHGGEPEMLAEISAVLTCEGFPHRLALASTPAAATALARAAPSGRILKDHEESDGLATLPVSALRLSEEAETLLRRFGLTQIGQLYGIDRKSLARRFQSKQNADAVLLRLDQALGLRHDPIIPLRPAPACTARLPCPEPIATNEGITHGLTILAETLCKDLQAFGQGARAFVLHAFRSDGTASAVEISAARPMRDAAHILRLFKERIDKIDPGFGIDLLLLEARRPGPMDTSAMALSGDLAAHDTDAVALAALTDRICAKLGEGSVRLTCPVESHLPERAETDTPFTGDLPILPDRAQDKGPRPIRILQTPEPVRVLAAVPDGPPLRFIWRKVTRSVTRADGPERLSPEWWRHLYAPPSAPSPDGSAQKWLSPKLDPRGDAALIAGARSSLQEQDAGEIIRSLPRARDYYRVEDESGRRYWLFRDGLYDDGRGGQPEWYVHGFFA